MWRMAKRRNHFGSVDPGDIAAMRAWAEIFATGESVESVAARIQVEPTMDAVVAEVTHGMTAETREAVAEVFRQEFEQTAARSGE
jgi:hypothetical protein